MALSLLSDLSPERLALAVIIQADAKTLGKSQGVGPSWPDASFGA